MVEVEVEVVVEMEVEVVGVVGWRKEVGMKAEMEAATNEPTPTMRLTLLSSDVTSMLTNVMAPLCVPAAASRRERISACCPLITRLGAKAQCKRKTHAPS